MTVAGWLHLRRAHGSRRGRRRAILSVAIVFGVCAPSALADTDLGTAGGLNYRNDFTSTATAGSGASANVACGAATRAVGGGVYVGGFGLGQHINSMPPLDLDSDGLPDEGWRLSFWNGSGAPKSGLVRVICAGFTARYRSVGVDVANGAAGTATASCPDGEEVSGGGARMSGAVSSGRINSAFPIDGTDRDTAADDGYRARGYNPGGGVKRLVVTAICVKRDLRYVAETQTLLPGDSFSYGPECPAGTHTIGGGTRLTGSASEARMTGSFPGDDASDADSIPNDNWNGQVANSPGGVTKSTTAYVICRG